MSTHKRCPWPGKDELYVKYHDEEWGKPIHDDRKHFEFLVLESAQAGLSWITILRKRENYRKLYDNFDYKKVARYDKKKIAKLMNDAGIIRNIKKIEASINNANKFLDIVKRFGSFDKYIWGFVKNKPIVNKWKTISRIPVKTKLSDEIAKDLKQRGFKFLGSITIYTHMQAIGLVNDHLVSCFRYGADPIN